ncbi:hypothetical protein [Pseudoxanthomonas kalamensis]|uniref:hypothetical protein n=1 Tax=Pseudoxanthomonas kalamensis TaxID=289483 RepID=UPI001390EFC1|nr:hypothetical protein [Pseudoxanthomonas kalamensis]
MDMVVSLFWMRDRQERGLSSARTTWLAVYCRLGVAVKADVPKIGARIVVAAAF